MAATIATVTSAIATALDGIAGLRVYAFPPKSAQAPFAFVVPESIDYDGAMRRGMDRMSITVYVGVAIQVDRAGWAAALAKADPTVVKAAIDAIGQNYRVQSVEFDEIQLAGATFLGGVYKVDVGA